jgi:hypothetical protein
MEVVRSTANEQVPFNVQGVSSLLHVFPVQSLIHSSQYLDEFSRALATEVRMLLGEVGKIREERRALQQYASTIS